MYGQQNIKILQHLLSLAARKPGTFQACSMEPHDLNEIKIFN